MSFNLAKQSCFSKKDKSIKQSIDAAIKPLCDCINSLKDYYTTSSCAGRIVLIKLAESGKKNEAEFILCSHKKTGFKELKIELLSAVQKTSDEIWFRFEALALHVACRTIESATKLLTIVRNLGLKRSGIITINNKIMVEIMSADKIDTIIAKQNNILIDDKYLKLLLNKANEKLKKNHELIKTLLKEFK